MAYVAPITWVTGNLVTAAQMNQDVRDNMIAVKAQVDTIYTVTHTEQAYAFDTNYQNATGKIKIVSIAVGFANGLNKSVSITIGTPLGPWPPTQVGIMRNNTNNIIQMAETFIVPDTWYYRAQQAGAPTLVDWHEWDLF